MKLDKDTFIELAKIYAEGGDPFGPCAESTIHWCEKNRLPNEIRNLFQTHIPKVSIGAGAGALFDESNLIRWNEDFPEALGAGLLIVGSAANGDHIAIDLKNGSVGYISHENDWQKQPRNYFATASLSIGFFLRDINQNPPLIPEDYWEVKA
jgi:hypothetical protein